MKVQKDTGKFLNSDEVFDQQTAVIFNEGEEVESQYGKRLQIGLNIEINGEQREKYLTLNPTTKNLLIDEYGDDTKNWVGKEVRVHVVQQKVGNSFKDVIFLTHPNKNLKGEEINL